jgi:hypothetical protein
MHVHQIDGSEYFQKKKYEDASYKNLVSSL